MKRKTVFMHIDCIRGIDIVTRLQMWKCFDCLIISHLF